MSADRSAARWPSLTAGAVAFGRAVGLDDVHDDAAGAALPAPVEALATGLRRLARLHGGGWLTTTLLAGLNAHASLRMAAIDAEVEAAVDEGVAQVVVVGAGFDTRAWRLGALDGVVVVEVDLPGTQAVKRRMLADRAPVAEVEFVTADLSRDRLDAALAPSPWRAGEPTMWVWEAVVPYLPDAAVRSTAAQLAALSAPGSRVAMTFAHAVGDGSLLGLVAGAIAGAAFRTIGEPLRSAYDDWDVTALLDEAGWRDPVVTGHREWASASGVRVRAQPFAPERLVTARR